MTRKKYYSQFVRPGDKSGHALNSVDRAENVGSIEHHGLHAGRHMDRSVKLNAMPEACA